MINHSTEANIVPRVVTDACNVPHLYFVSSKRIEKDKQLFFSYGDIYQRKSMVKKNVQKMGSNRGSNQMGTFINDEAEVSGDDSGDESQVLLEDTESDKEFLDDNLSEISDIPPNPYLDKVSVSLEKNIEDNIFSPQSSVDIQSPPAAAVITQSQIPPTPEKTARKFSFESKPQDFIDNNIFNCLSPLENAHQHPREIYAVMILKWTFDDNRPFSIVRKDFDIDFLASQTKLISGIFPTEVQ